MSSLTTLQTLGAAAAAGTSIWIFASYVWPALKRVGSAIACAWGRLKAVWSTLEQMPGLLTEYLTLKTTVDDLSGIAEQVRLAVVEGPDSLQAQTRQLTEQGNARGEQLAGVARKVDNLGHTLRATQNANPRLATFQADHDGQLLSANRTFLTWTGLPLEDAARWGWANAIHPEDVERVRAAIRGAVADARRLVIRFRLIHINGTSCEVEATAEPCPEGSSPAERWEWFLYRTAASGQQAAAA